MTKHPCAKLGKAATEAFEQIATGDPLPAMPKATVTKLIAKGVIERGPDKMLRDGLGGFAIPQYFVPFAVHMQWCTWCSEQSDEALLLTNGHQQSEAT